MMTNSSSGTLGLYTDYYELTMAQGYFLAGKKDEATVFDYFYRTNAFEGGFMVFAGLSDFLIALADFRYPKESIEYLDKLGFHSGFLEYLKEFRFNGTIFSVKKVKLSFPMNPYCVWKGILLKLS